MGRQLALLGAARTSVIPRHRLRTGTSGGAPAQGSGPEPPVPCRVRCGARAAMMAGSFALRQLAEQADAAHGVGAPIEPENALQTLLRSDARHAPRARPSRPSLVDTAEQMVADFPLVPGWRCALRSSIIRRASRRARASSSTSWRSRTSAGLPRDPRLDAGAFLPRRACSAFEDGGAAAALYRSMVPFSRPQRRPVRHRQQWLGRLLPRPLVGNRRTA